ncbi:MAG: murein biosynthesis integral membrane protein MurJ, partial [Syntrophaceae bacterium]|nr:murein biosynthesis integral membrane protein MurJ [Syntrophaceae bacterium]
EGALTAAFIPTYVEVLQKRGVSEAAKLAQVAFTFSGILLCAVTLLGVTFTPYVVELIAPGFGSDPYKFSLTVELTRIMFPYIFFISLVALLSGALNSFGIFAPPAAAPLLLNMTMIGSVLVFSAHYKCPAYYSLSWAVILAGFFQLLLQLPFLPKLGIKLSLNFDFSNPALRKMGALFVPAAIGGAVYQVNVLVGTILASMLPAGGVSWLYYADRLVELPLGIFAIALGTAVLPSMSRLAGQGDNKALMRSLSFSLNLIAFLTIPASVGLIILREPIISILFQRGMFTYVDTQETAYALLFYTSGLWAYSGLKVVTQAFFSLKDTKTPLWVSIGSVLTNLLFGIALMGPLRHGGLAFATAISASFNLLILFVVLVRRIGFFPTHDFCVSLMKTILASCVMGLILWFFKDSAEWSQGLNSRNGLILSGLLAGGILAYFISAFVLKCSETKILRSLIKGSRT